MPYVTLDAGALLFKRPTINPLQEEQEKMTAAAIVEGYNLIGYNAVCVGSQDLIAGLPYLQALSKKAKFAWLSANLVKKKTNKPIFKRSISLKAGRVRIGVIGLTGPAILSVADDAIVQPWDQVLPPLLAKVTKRDDLIILLSNLPAADNQRIAETFSSIHLIVQSGATAGVISPEPVNNTVIVSSAPQGKQLGIMKINWQPSKRWGDQKAEVLAKKKASQKQLLWQLSKYQQDKDPETALRNRPDQLTAYRILLAREQKLRGEIDQLAKEIAKTPRKGEPSAYSNRFIDMETTLPDQPEVARVMNRLKAAINELGQRKAASTSPTDSPYLGFRACGKCHERQLAAWLQTRHAKAYTTLEQKKQQFNQNCLPCHVTGVPLAQAAEALSLQEDRRRVGCETCHGPGRRHRENPKANIMIKKPGSGVCQACHREPNDDNFDYDKEIKMVDHK